MFPIKHLPTTEGFSLRHYQENMQMLLSPDMTTKEIVIAKTRYIRFMRDVAMFDNHVEEERYDISAYYHQKSLSDIKKIVAKHLRLEDDITVDDIEMMVRNPLRLEGDTTVENLPNHGFYLTVNIANRVPTMVLTVESKKDITSGRVSLIIGALGAGETIQEIMEDIKAHLEEFK